MRGTGYRAQIVVSLGVFACAVALPVRDAGADAAGPLPGARFETIEEAAAYALRYAHWAHPKYESGGLILPLARGGFTFTEPTVSEGRKHVRIRISPEAVAHFHTHPGWVPVRNKTRCDDGHSDTDRAIVKIRDPLHRPSFVSYRGGKVWRFGRCSAKSFCERSVRRLLALRAQR